MEREMEGERKRVKGNRQDKRHAKASSFMRLLKRHCPFHSPFTPLLILLTPLFIVSCIPTTPSQYIQPDDIEDILVDYHFARALAHNSGLNYDSVAYYQALYTEAVFRKHGITQELFDSSMVYYYTRADRFEAIYKRVADRLEERALILGATEGEIGKYASLNANGDTANIWPDRTRMAMIPTPPYNRWDFRIEVDTTFRHGDSFLLQFVSDYTYQDGTKNGVVYMAFTYNGEHGDTTISRNLHFLTSGISQLRFPECNDADLKDIRGFFYLGDGNDRSTTTRLLFINNVQLIRFHKKHEETKKDSLSQSSAANKSGLSTTTDTLSRGDSVGSGRPLVPLDSGAATNGVATRRHRIER